MLRWRLLVSAVLIPSIISLFVWDARQGPRAPVLLVICLLAGVRCAWELATMLRRDQVTVRFVPVASGVVFLIACTWAPHWRGSTDRGGNWLPPLDLAFAVWVLWLMVHSVFQFRGPGGHARTLGAEVFSLGYAGLLLCVTAQLRWLDPAGSGYLALGSLIAAAKMGDVGAYTLGRLLGRRKMAPHLSPGKTWMGALGAVLGAALGAVVWLRAFSSYSGLAWEPQSWVWAAGYGAIIGVAGLLGDLCESMLKRDVGVKDSATIFPGFGGLLDLLDSILFAGPVAVMLWRWSL